MAYKISQTNIESQLITLANIDSVKGPLSSRAVVVEDKQNLVNLKSIPKVRDRLQTLRNV